MNYYKQTKLRKDPKEQIRVYVQMIKDGRSTCPTSNVTDLARWETARTIANSKSDAELMVRRLLLDRQHWSRHVSSGFSASEVARVTETTVMLSDGRSLSLDKLNRRELEETLEALRPLFDKSTFSERHPQPAPDRAGKE